MKWGLALARITCATNKGFWHTPREVWTGQPPPGSGRRSPAQIAAELNKKEEDPPILREGQGTRSAGSNIRGARGKKIYVEKWATRWAKPPNRRKDQAPRRDRVGAVGKGQLSDLSLKDRLVLLTKGLGIRLSCIQPLTRM